MKNAKEILSQGGIDQLLIELCATNSSQLTQTVPPRAAAIRITETADLTNDKTLRVVRDVIRYAAALYIKVITWTSTPCTAGCPWRHVNRKMEIHTGDAALTDTLTKICTLFTKLYDRYLCYS